MVYFTSDLHLFHENIIKYVPRPFATVEEMNATIIENINNTVLPEDTLWILGDVCMGREKIQRCADFLAQLNCKDVHLITGNHDARNRRDDMLAAGFMSMSDYEEIKINRHRIAVLCHYPLMSWKGQSQGSIMLHGHIHASRSYNEKNCADGILRYDVGVDANDYKPVSLDAIREFFQSMPKMPAIDA